jgi:hypothetical protein
MVDVGQHVGASALEASAQLGQLFQPGGNCGAQGVDDRGHDGLSAAPIRAGIGGDDPLTDAPGHGDRDAAAPFHPPVDGCRANLPARPTPGRRTAQGGELRDSRGGEFRGGQPLKPGEIRDG